VRTLPLLIFTAFLLILVFTTTDGKEPRRAVMDVNHETVQQVPSTLHCPLKGMVLKQLNGEEDWIFLIPSPVNCRET
jgi:hypothetical protein